MLAGHMPSESLRVLVDDEVRKIAEECYEQALQILRQHRESLDSLARVLLERETLDEHDAYAAAGLPRPERVDSAVALVAESSSA